MTALALATLLASLGTSIANVGLPALATAFGASFGEVRWVVIAYLLSVTGLIVGAGRLGDVMGRRRVLLAGIGAFVLASALCGVAPGMGMLLAARALQGAGAAAMMALTLAMVGESVSRDRVGGAIGLLGTMSAVGTALGPSLGGLLLSAAGWRALFLVLVPLGLVTLAAAHRSLPADSHPVAARLQGFDPVGTVLLTAAIAAYALAMTIGAGLPSAVLLGAAAVAAVAFLAVEASVASPLVPPRLLRDPLLLQGLLTTSLVMTVVMATLVVGPFYLTHALGLGAAAVGAVMSVGPVVSALTSAPAGRMVDRFGERMIGLGLAGMAAGCTGLALLPAGTGTLGYAAAIAVTTAGYALFQASTSASVMKQASPDARGLLSGLLGLSRNLGLISGAAGMGALFDWLVGSNDIATAAPDAVARGLRGTFAAGALLIGLAAALAVRLRAVASRRGAGTGLRARTTAAAIAPTH